MTVYAAYQWKSNAELIADLAKLGYITGHVLDPTYGKGVFWKIFTPDKLSYHDIMIDGVDFRNLPYDNEHFDTVVFDPPYVAPGGRVTAKVSYYERYGLLETPKSPYDLWEYNKSGIDECIRVLKKRGCFLIKLQDYISSGKFCPFTFLIWQYVTDKHSLELEDVLHMITHPRPQPAHRKQQHARRNHSTMMVFRKV
jgi:hypothetical protein